jgi:hypothetical protein
VEAFCLTPVIACLFFMASVVYVGDASVSLRLLLLVSSSWLVLSMLEMQVSLYCMYAVAYRYITVNTKFQINKMITLY